MEEIRARGFVKMDTIDMRKVDEELQRRVYRVWTKQKISDDRQGQQKIRFTDSKEEQEEEEEEWEIDPAGKLVVKGVIARGTFGSVHRGVYDGKDVAVKVLDLGEGKKLRKAFLQEVSVWHKLDHPNVTKFIGATGGRTEITLQVDDDEILLPSNMCCIVLEYLPGGNLKNYLIKNRLRKLPFDVVVRLALDLARGLSYLHSEKIVHRDVKTENILLDAKRTPKITDFGVARFEASNPNEMTGKTGTLGYMAPEVFSQNSYDRKCDVYSFGICLWEIYCCAMPYPNLGPLEQASAVVYKNLRPEIPRCCPSSLANLMKRCWNADPKRRPEMEEVVQTLEAIDTSKGGGMIPPDQFQGCFCFFRHRGP
ncbi:hypothetical protein RJ639_000299 [Escallonia herrerae]|uniref:Protein kinase domain-containing protein n=1 Tax=Escallonia herrerae TaxID=1293975 RepID=A0AA88XFE3_9ASTE|nr:hypothetical protein RJ639_000299 [Escallonia herrerae]